MRNNNLKYSNCEIVEKFLKIFTKIIPFIFIYIIFNEIFTNTYSYSLGSDEIIVLSIPQYAISNAQNLLDYFYAVAYGLFYEDHLNITVNILSPLILDLSQNNSIQFPNGLLYISALFLFYFLAKEITKNHRLALFSVFIATSNFSAIWYLSTSNATFIVSLIFQLSAIYLSNKNLDTCSYKSLFLLFFISVFGTFSFENYFLCYFVIATLMISNSFKNLKNILEIPKLLITKQLKLIIILISSLVPYFVMHYLKFNSILPNSRVNNIENINPLIQIAKTFIKIANELFFGLPEILFQIISDSKINQTFLILITIVLVFLSIKIIKFKKIKYKTLLSCILVSLFIASATGRYHPGMWTLCWFIFSLYIARVAFGLLDNNRIKSISIMTIPAIILVISNLSVMNSKSISNLKEYNQRSYLLDETLNLISPNLSDNSIFIDLSKDKIFHEIRILLSERSLLGLAPAEINGFSFGSQPLNSSIHFATKKFYKDNNNFSTHNFKEYTVFILDSYILKLKNNSKGLYWSLYKWDSCNENSYSKNLRDNQLISLSKELGINQKELLGALNYVGCELPQSKKTINKDNPIKISEHKIVKIKSFDDACRIEIYESNSTLKILSFMKKNSIFIMQLPKSYPIIVKSMTTHSNHNERFENNYRLLNEEQFLEKKEVFCKLKTSY